jgi:hypothetical protein
MPNYFYYSDPNEIVSRLKLLLASTLAGNDSHKKEIKVIENELRELRIIR